MWKQRLLRGGAPRVMDMLVCSADGDGDEGGGGSGGGGDDKDEAVKRISAKLDEVLGEKKKLAEKVRGFEAAEAERKAEEAKREEEKARKDKDFETIENGYKDKLSRAEGETYLWKSRYENLVIDRGIEEALDAAKVNPALKKAAVALLKSDHPPDPISEDGKATIDGKPIGEFIAAWTKTDTGKAFVLNGNSGGGAGGGGNGGGGGGDVNPWKPGATFNLTQQGKLLRDNPELAARLKREAGVR